MKFIEEQGAYACEVGVSEHLTDKDSLGDKEKAGLAAGGVVEPDPVADLITQTGAPFLSHACREHAGGEASRLQDHGTARAKDPGIEEHLRDLGRFSRTGGGLHDETVPLTESRDDRITQFLDRQIGAADCFP